MQEGSCSRGRPGHQGSDLCLWSSCWSVTFQEISFNWDYVQVSVAFNASQLLDYYLPANLPTYLPTYPPPLEPPDNHQEPPDNRQELGDFYFWHTPSDPRDLWPLRHLIRVMKRHDLTKKDLPHLPTHLPTSLPDYQFHLQNNFKERFQRLVTFETFDQSDEETWHYQKNYKDKYKDNDKDKDNDKGKET